jgi:hypothetical protein
VRIKRGPSLEIAVESSSTVEVTPPMRSDRDVERRFGAPVARRGRSVSGFRLKEKPEIGRPRGSDSEARGMTHVAVVDEELLSGSNN